MLATPSVSGDEGAFAALMVELYKDAGAERVELDLTGNVLAWKGEDPDRALVAHMDTVGFMVEAVEDPGCPLVAVGGVQPASHQRATLVRHGGEAIDGLVVSGPGPRELVFEPLDRGALGQIEVGDRVSYALHHEVRGDYLQGPYLDNRIGCWVALEALREADSLQVICTSTEETTVRGAMQARRNMEGVDSALVLDVTYGAARGEPARVELGKGPVLSLKDTHMPARAATESVKEAARRVGVRLQYEVSDQGGSDMMAFASWDRPILSCFLGVASRYNHRPFEVVHLGDVEQLLRVVHSWRALGPVAGERQTSTKRGPRRRKV
jgi:endoglucanase